MSWRDDSYQELSETNRQSPYAQFSSHSKGLAKVKGVYTLYVTKTPEASSLYPPNTPLIKRWRQDDVFDVAGEVDIDCITLEEMLSSKKVNYVDVIKIDTQGSELDILLGAGRYLDKISIIKCEVEFVELYRGQPLFDDVVRELSKCGFRFVDFFDGASCGHERDKQKRIWGDAIFIKKSIPDTDKSFKAASVLIDMSYYEEANWLIEDNGEDSRLLQALIDAHISDLYYRPAFLMKINARIEKVGKRNKFIEKIRQILVRVITRFR